MLRDLRMFEDLESTWELVLPVQIDDVEFETNPDFMKVTPEMGAGKISVADARRLKAGDVIVLETHPDELAVVHVDDKPKYLSYACRSKHGKNSVKVAGVVPASEQEKYRNRC